MDLLSIVTVEYTSVASHDIIKKMEVAAALQTTQQPSITSLSKLCKVSRTFMRKIFSELVQHGNLVPPDQKRRHTESGPYSKKLDEINAFVILFLYMEEPSQGLHAYALWLEHFTGTQVSDSLLSPFFNNAFPTRGGLYHQKLSHFNKFHPENCIRMIEYIQILAKINSHCIKFDDEKSVKGREINCKVQKNSLT
jgi:hypothetical protein